MIKEKIPKELKSKLFLSVMLFAILQFIVWNLVPNKWIRLSSLVLFTIIFIVYRIKKETKKDFFQNIGLNFFTPLLLLLILVYLLLIFNKIKEGVWMLIIGFVLIMLLLILNYTYSFLKKEYKLSRKIDLMRIIANYIILVLLIIIFFGYLFLVNSSFPENSLNGTNFNNSNFNDYIYFSSVTFYSLGYGDISPVGGIMRLTSQIEVLFGAVLHLIIIGSIISNATK